VVLRALAGGDIGWQFPVLALVEGDKRCGPTSVRRGKQGRGIAAVCPPGRCPPGPGFRRPISSENLMDVEDQAAAEEPAGWLASRRCGPEGCGIPSDATQPKETALLFSWQRLDRYPQVRPREGALLTIGSGSSAAVDGSPSGADPCLARQPRE